LSSSPCQHSFAWSWSSSSPSSSCLSKSNPSVGGAIAIILWLAVECALPYITLYNSGMKSYPVENALVSARGKEGKTTDSPSSRFGRRNKLWI
jgi:hypothetical protein